LREWGVIPIGGKKDEERVSRAEKKKNKGGGKNSPLGPCKRITEKKGGEQKGWDWEKNFSKGGKE